MINMILEYSRNFGVATGLGAAVFELSSRNFVAENEPLFCKNDCPLEKNGECNFQTAHLYGCFEAERWNGLYIYHCPAGLSFTQSIVNIKGLPAFSLASGPVLTSEAEDLPAQMQAEHNAIKKLPQRPASEVSAVATVQKALCDYLSNEKAQTDSEKAKAQSAMLNSLYEAGDEIGQSGRSPYPLELEQRLQKMILNGDKQGAQELINQLLGAVYFNSGGNFKRIRERAKELVVLFSRASMEGGADVGQIFGQFDEMLEKIEACKTLDELSVLLTRIFYRFVGYVFDFSSFEHSDILHKTINYVRENYTLKIGLEDVAEHVGLSRSYLSGIIKQGLGLSFTDYVNSLRIEKSKELLLDYELSLAEISLLVGYSDQSYFTKVFTKLTGMSPGQYRKKRGK